MDAALPLEKLMLESVDEDSSSQKEKMHVVLLSTGSFNPPTFMHLRLFELARDALNSKGFHVVGGYMSPVNDAYQKKGLIPAEHRIAMCQLACKSSEFIMVDAWEAKQSSYQRSLTVMSRIRSFFCDNGLIPSGMVYIHTASGVLDQLVPSVAKIFSVSVLFGATFISFLFSYYLSNHLLFFSPYGYFQLANLLLIEVLNGLIFPKRRYPCKLMSFKESYVP